MKFLTELDVLDLSDCKQDRYVLQAPLVFDAEFAIITVPTGFTTDFASVPRLPIVYMMWGNRAHREAVLHDYLYRQGAIPHLDRYLCDELFRLAMISRGNPWWMAQCMYIGVRAAGWLYYKKGVLNVQMA